MSKEKVINIARSELGYTEVPPNSNCTKYGSAYGLQGQPWCVIFLWWCFRQAGEAGAFFGGAKTASCGTLLRWYKEQGQIVSASDVLPGDIVILNFHGTKDTEHCGLVIDQSSVVDPNTGAPRYIVTIEGNTTPGYEGSQDNGGCVALKKRVYNQIVAVCRPIYTIDQPKPDYSGHWAEEAIKWNLKHGIMNGYSDGSFKPNDYMTRAEVAQVIYDYTKQWVKTS